VRDRTGDEPHRPPARRRGGGRAAGRDRRHAVAGARGRRLPGRLHVLRDRRPPVRRRRARTQTGAAAARRPSRGGARMRIRRLTSDDASLLDRIFEGMSATSRYRRYHSPKPRLTSAERRYLAGADGRRHLALIAFGPGGDPIGVGRAVRFDDDATAAEMAVEVVDAWHRRGVGMELVRRLSDDAAAVGIERLTAVVLTDTWLGAMLERKGWRVHRT